MRGSRGNDVLPWRPPSLFSTRPPSLMRPLRMMGAFTRAVESAADSGGSTSAEAHGQRRRDRTPSSVPCISDESVEKRHRVEDEGRHLAMETFCDIATTFSKGRACG